MPLASDSITSMRSDRARVDRSCGREDADPVGPFSVKVHAVPVRGRLEYVALPSVALPKVSRTFVVAHLAAITVGLVLAAAIYSTVRWDAHAFDRPGGSSVGTPTLVGQPYTVGIFFSNTSDEPVTVERVALVGDSRGITVLGMEPIRPGHAIGTAHRHPCPTESCRYRPQAA